METDKEAILYNAYVDYANKIRERVEPFEEFYKNFQEEAVKAIFLAMDTYSASLIKEWEKRWAIAAGQVNDAEMKITKLQKENEELKNSLEGNQEIREGLEILLDACKSANTQLQSTNEAKEKEIERLKGLIEQAHDSGWRSGYSLRTEMSDSWKDFKTENNL